MNVEKGGARNEVSLDSEGKLLQLLLRDNKAVDKCGSNEPGLQKRRADAQALKKSISDPHVMEKYKPRKQTLKKRWFNLSLCCHSFNKKNRVPAKRVTLVRLEFKFFFSALIGLQLVEDYFFLYPFTGSLYFHQKIYIYTQTHTSLLFINGFKGNPKSSPFWFPHKDGDDVKFNTIILSWIFSF